MGLLNIFGRKEPSGVRRLPAGSFTIDCHGKLLVCTLPQSYPKEPLLDIARQLIETFQAAQSARLTLKEIVVNYAAFRLTARELRGGAIVFLAPRSPAASANPNT